MAKVSIVKCSSYDKAKVLSAVRKGLKEIDFCIPDGKKVLVKVNLLRDAKPEQAVTTHPAVVDAVLKVLKQKKCKITVGDSSANPVTKNALKTSGVAAVAKKYNAETIAFEEVKAKCIEDSDAKILKEITVYGDIDKFDVIVNLPKMKTHGLTKYTGAVKNLLGLVPGGTKSSYHLKAVSEEKFSSALIDIYQNVRKKIVLNLMDGIIGMEGEGPGNGTPKKSGVIVASKDAASLDYVASQIVGYEAEEILTTKECIARDLLDDEKVEIIGKLENLEFKKPVTAAKTPGIARRLFFRQMMKDPHVIKENCKKCARCAKICPSKAITMVDYPEINLRKCIHCYCCHEVCPYSAMELRSSRIGGFIKKVADVVRRGR